VDDSAIWLFGEVFVLGCLGVVMVLWIWVMRRRWWQNLHSLTVLVRVVGWMLGLLVVVRLLVVVVICVRDDPLVDGWLRSGHSCDTQGVFFALCQEIYPNLGCSVKISIALSHLSPFIKLLMNVSPNLELFDLKNSQIWSLLKLLFLEMNVSAFRDRGVPGPTSEMSPRAPAQMGRREAERKGGK
jgi:hypothetical protein